MVGETLLAAVLAVPDVGGVNKSAERLMDCPTQTLGVVVLAWRLGLALTVTLPVIALEVQPLAFFTVRV